ncbi:hypothetical protein ACOMHN_057610 [Nucella lapillus]
MPVSMADTSSTQLPTSTYEMDKLVEEVRERLCLRSREKQNASRRSTPYSRKGCSFVDSPDHGSSPHHYSSHKARDYKRTVCSQCSWKMSKCKCIGSSDLSETPNLLKQLLAEHRLIQEAVRRIHLFKHHPCDELSSTKLEQSESSPCSARSISTDSVDSTTFSSTTDL